MSKCSADRKLKLQVVHAHTDRQPVTEIDMNERIFTDPQQARACGSGTGTDSDTDRHEAGAHVLTMTSLILKYSAALK